MEGGLGCPVEMDLGRLRQNLEGVRRRIAEACVRTRRDRREVTLVVVTKSVPAESIPRLAELDVTDIAEHRPIEGLRRIGTLAGFRRHMVGHVQSNKVQKMLLWADVLHSLDRAALVAELARQKRRLPAFVQINVSGEPTKGGYRPEEIQAVVEEARKAVEVLGLMTIAPQEGEPRTVFRRLRGLAQRCDLPYLSMGMTSDFEAAVEEGATHVRIGSAIFEGVFRYS